MNEAADFYDRLIAQHGTDARGLAFASHTSQHLRFCSFLEAVPLGPDDSVLDIGCGFGDLHPFLAQLGHRGDYQGWDVSGAAVAESRRRHPQLADRFECRDVFATDSGGPIPSGPASDWVFCSGTFNIGCTEAEGHAALRRLFGHARKGLVVTYQNARGTHRPPPADGYRRAKYAPEAIYADAKAITPWVVLRDDYLPHDFLVALLHRPGWELRSGITPISA